MTLIAKQLNLLKNCWNHLIRKNELINYDQKILVIPLKNLEDFIIKENESKKLCILRAIKLDGKILDFEMKNSQVGLIKINTILDHHQFVSVK
jgi:hypothetical protein